MVRSTVQALAWSAFKNLSKASPALMLQAALPKYHTAVAAQTHISIVVNVILK
jgi:hypothetical protein